MGTLLGRAGSARWLSYKVVFIVIGCALGVFLLPWHLPINVSPLVSDSQIVGFANRAAEFSLGLGAVLLALLAWSHRIDSKPFVALQCN